MKKAAKVDHAAALRLVAVIDEEGTRLSKGEIDFIAGIIDNKQKTFDERELRKIQRVHQRRVVNGKPDYDL